MTLPRERPRPFPGEFRNSSEVPASAASARQLHPVGQVATSRSVLPHSPTGRPTPSPLVLIVDDYGDTRRWIAALLEGSGFRTREAEDGQQALEAVLEERPDVILMDFAMPNMDGPTAIRALRHLPGTAHVPIVVLTGSAGSARRVAHEAGCTTFVTKPCVPATLLTLVRSLVARTAPEAGR